MVPNKPSGGLPEADSAQPASQPEVRFQKTDAYRESYANSVQIRMSVWDLQLVFGTVNQVSPTEVDLNNFQAIYMSPQQAKALHNLLSQNLAQYEKTFGKIALEPAPAITVIPVPPTNGSIN